MRLFGFVGHLQCSIAQAADHPPNVIIFLADNLGYGDLACYGNPIVKAPHLDRFASEGVRVTDCHSGGTVCSPSRAALLTGRKPYRSGFFYIHNRCTAQRQRRSEVPDFTHGGKIKGSHDWSLGPTAARGWIYAWKHTADARQILITKVAKGSPADGVLKVDDVILGVEGKPFDDDWRMQFAEPLRVPRRSRVVFSSSIASARNG